MTESIYCAARCGDLDCVLVPNHSGDLHFACRYNGGVQWRGTSAPIASPSTTLPSGAGSHPSAGIRAEESADSPTDGASSVAGSGVSHARSTRDTANIASTSTEPPKTDTSGSVVPVEP